MIHHISVQQPSFPDRFLSLLDFDHAKDEFSFKAGRTNGRSIQKGIDSLSAQGGGTLGIPAGFWACSPIVLKSGVQLRLERGALLKFIKHKEDYPLVVTDYEGQSAIRTVSPISSEGAVNIAITGAGMIDGSGDLWRPVKRFKVTDSQWNTLLEKGGKVLAGKELVWFPTETSYLGALRLAAGKGEDDLQSAQSSWDFYRPVLVDLKHSRQVLLQGVTFTDSPAWCIHTYFCEDVTVDGIQVKNAYWAQNGDGIDVESCRNVEIKDSVFETGDDAICLKSGKNAQARKTPGPCELVWIHDCTVFQGHGGFVIGSEMSRGVRDILVQRCLFLATDVGVRVKSALGRGGVVEDIDIQDIRMVGIKHESIILTMGYALNSITMDEQPVQESEEDIPLFRDIHMDGMCFLGQQAKLRIVPLPGRDDTIQRITVNGTLYNGAVLVD